MANSHGSISKANREKERLENKTGHPHVVNMFNGDFGPRWEVKKAKWFRCSNGHVFHYDDRREESSPGKGFGCPECNAGMLNTLSQFQAEQKDNYVGPIARDPNTLNEYRVT